MAVSSSQPSLRGARIAPGHILVNDKFHGSEIVKALQENHVNVIVDNTLGIIDFHPSSGIGVIYLTEAELVSGADYRAKLKKLAKASFRQFILAEKSRLTEQYYRDLQKIAVIELGLTLLPVLTLADAAKILGQMVHVESRPLSNPYRVKKKPPPPDPMLLTTVQSVPGLGRKKALALLTTFHSLEGISKASIESLSSVVGRASAQQVKDFFSLTMYGTPSKKRCQSNP